MIFTAVADDPYTLAREKARCVSTSAYEKALLTSPAGSSTIVCAEPTSGGDRAKAHQPTVLVEGPHGQGILERAQSNAYQVFTLTAPLLLRRP